ncbi:MAG: hypothetical protein GY718_10645 [Lentisphaerae bacterium]|nr:hypothetical protein [Lentisphaerota bacterium]
MMRLRRNQLLMGVILNLFLLSTTLGTGLPVIDAANFLQNVLEYAEMLLLVIDSMENVRMAGERVKMMQRNLEAIIQVAKDPDLSLIEKAKSISFKSKNIKYALQGLEEQYADLYPRWEAIISPVEIFVQREMQRKAKEESNQNSMKMQAIINEQLDSDREDMNAVIQQSRNASGRLQAMQAQSELIHIQNKQLMRMQQLQAVQGRERAHENARELSEQRAAIAYKKYMIGNWENPQYTEPGLSRLP